MWTVAQTKPGEEFRAQHNITAQGYRVFMPLYACRRKRKEKVVTEHKPLFTSYLFVYADKNWGPINSTRGVSRLLADPDGRPYVIPDTEMAALMDQYSDVAELDDSKPERLKPGTRVRIMEGPAQGLWGRVKTHLDNGTVWLMMDGGVFGVVAINEKLVDRNGIPK